MIFIILLKNFIIKILITFIILLLKIKLFYLY